MIKILIISLFILSGCSLQSPVNKAQYAASNAFNSYTKNFLSDNNLIAKSELHRAINNAKLSADLDALARIYLGQCALNISVGIEDKCQNYKNIKELIDSNNLDNYCKLITLEVQDIQIDKLPITYKKFTKYLNDKNYNKAYQEILKMDSEVSQLISASLIRKYLDRNQINKIIKISSYHGYKKSNLFWLKELRNTTVDDSENKKLTKIISILESK